MGLCAMITLALIVFVAAGGAESLQPRRYSQAGIQTNQRPVAVRPIPVYPQRPQPINRQMQPLYTLRNKRRPQIVRQVYRKVKKQTIPLVNRPGAPAYLHGPAGQQYRYSPAAGPSQYYAPQQSIQVAPQQPLQVAPQEQLQLGPQQFPLAPQQLQQPGLQAAHGSYQSGNVYQGQSPSLHTQQVSQNPSIQHYLLQNQPTKGSQSYSYLNMYQG